MLTAPTQAPEQPPSRLRLGGPVVVAVGPSGGVAAINAARAIASREGRELVVISVVTPPPAYTFETNRSLLLPWLVEQETAERRDAVHGLLRGLGMHGTSRDLSIEIPYGEPPVEITRHARLCGAGLIVMGIGPHEARRRLLSAGTVAAVCQHAPCPVLAVGEHSRMPAHVAVVATDFSGESVYAARIARRLLAEDAVVDVVHAWHRLDAVVPSVAVATLNESYRESLAGQFDRVQDALAPGRSLTIYPVTLEGKPAEIVLGVARAKRADLIVAATHGHGALYRWLLGSTSSALLRGADCSVLLVPSPPLSVRERLEQPASESTASFDREEWNDELRSFVQRNRDRRTRLEIDAASLGAQVQESGYVLAGAAYDPRDDRLALMFGGARVGEPHFTHSLGDVRSVSVRSDPDGREEALYIQSSESSALLTFLPDTAPRSSDIA
jgi:nucleotide-binding universal stress UspA family protein